MTRPLQLGSAAILAIASALLASRLPVPGDRPYDVEFVPSAAVLRWASLGHPTLAANVYYLRMVQYLGEPRAGERGWQKLHPLADLVTELDPEHGYAYQVAGTILGSVDRVPESNAILEKGMRNVPSRYILPFLRAFNAFYYEGDYAEAGRFVEIAARTPNAPEHLRQNVLAMYVKGRRADAALAFLERARDEARDETSRLAIDEQIKRALLERDATALDEAVARYRVRHGILPFSLELLVVDGLVRSIPADPFGGIYVIGDDGRVRSSVNELRFAPPAKPGSLPREPNLYEQRPPP